MTCETQRLKQLEDENRKLSETNARLQAELEVLRSHPVFLAGIKGETLVCELVKGKLTSFAKSYDIVVDKCKIEVKYSNLGTPVRGHPTRRWSWSKPLGWLDKGKDYDYLVLVGAKDQRFPEQYLDSSPYLCFVIPRSDVEMLMFKGKSIGGVIQITSNFKSITNKQSKKLLSYMVKLEDILALIEGHNELAAAF